MLSQSLRGFLESLAQDWYQPTFLKSLTQCLCPSFHSLLSLTLICKFLDLKIVVFYIPSHCLRLYSFKPYLFDHGIFHHTPSRLNASQLGTASCITIGNRLVPVVSPSLILLIPVQIYTVFGLNLILDLSPSLEKHKLTFAFKRTYFYSAVSVRTQFCSISDGGFADQHTKSMNC